MRVILPTLLVLLAAAAAASTTHLALATGLTELVVLAAVAWVHAGATTMRALVWTRREVPG